MTFDKINNLVQSNLSPNNYVGIVITGSLYSSANDIVNICFYLPNSHIVTTYIANMKKVLYECTTTRNIVNDIISYLSNSYTVNLCATHSDMKSLVYHIREK